MRRRDFSPPLKVAGSAHPNKREGRFSRAAQLGGLPYRSSAKVEFGLPVKVDDSVNPVLVGNPVRTYGPA